MGGSGGGTTISTLPTYLENLHKDFMNNGLVSPEGFSNSVVVVANEATDPTKNPHLSTNPETGAGWITDPKDLIYGLKYDVNNYQQEAVNIQAMTGGFKAWRDEADFALTPSSHRYINDIGNIYTDSNVVGDRDASQVAANNVANGISSIWNDFGTVVADAKSHALSVANTLTPNGDSIYDDADNKSRTDLVGQIRAILPNVSGVSVNANIVERLQGIIEAQSGTARADAVKAFDSYASSQAVETTTRSGAETNARTSFSSSISTSGDITGYLSSAVPHVINVVNDYITNYLPDQRVESSTGETSALASAQDAITAIIPDASQTVTDIIDDALAAAGKAVDNVVVDKLVDEFEEKNHLQHVRRRATFSQGMSNINAVSSSSYTMGLAILEIERSRQTAEFRAQTSFDIFKQTLATAAQSANQIALTNIQSSVSLIEGASQRLVQRETEELRLTAQRFESDTQNVLSMFGQKLNNISTWNASNTDLSKTWEQLRHSIYSLGMDKSVGGQERLLNTVISTQLQLLQASASRYNDIKKFESSTQTETYMNSFATYLTEHVKDIMSESMAKANSYDKAFQITSDVFSNLEMQGNIDKVKFASQVLNSYNTYSQIAMQNINSRYQLDKDAFTLDISTSTDFQQSQIENLRAAKLFPLEVYQYVGNSIASGLGATGSTGTSRPSKTQSALSGALGGASAGAQVGGPWGAVAGAIGGGLLGAFS